MEYISVLQPIVTSQTDMNFVHEDYAENLTSPASFEPLLLPRASFTLATPLSNACTLVLPRYLLKSY